LFKNEVDEDFEREAFFLIKARPDSTPLRD